MQVKSGSLKPTLSPTDRAGDPELEPIPVISQGEQQQEIGNRGAAGTQTQVLGQDVTLKNCSSTLINCASEFSIFIFIKTLRKN